VAIVEGYHHLRGLIVGRSMAKIATRGELCDHPVPAEIRKLRGIDIDGSFEPERGFGASEMQRGGISLAGEGDVRDACVDFQFPTLRKLTGDWFIGEEPGGIENNKSCGGRVGLECA